jgi:hypothetical protein
VDYHIGYRDRGVFHADLLMHPITSLRAIPNAIIESHLTLYRRLPDPLHMLENVSQSVFAHLSTWLGKQRMQHVFELIRTVTGITKLTGLVPSYRWRLVWASYPLTWAVAFPGPAYDVERAMVRHLSMISSILYAKPEHRSAKSWLRLIGATFSLHRALSTAGVSIKLSEHLLWPHTPAVFGLIDSYNLSCESHEYLWKCVRKLLPAVDLTASDAITQLVTHLCAQNYARYLRVDKRDKQRHAKLRQWWKDESIDRLTVTGDSAPLQAMLANYGFTAPQWWHREKDTLILHIASADTNWPHPQLQSLSQSASATAELHASYMRHIPSIAHAHYYADTIQHAAATDMQIERDRPSPAVSAEPDASVDDVDYSSDEEWLPSQ